MRMPAAQSPQEVDRELTGPVSRPGFAHPERRSGGVGRAQRCAVRSDGRRCGIELAVPAVMFLDAQRFQFRQATDRRAWTIEAERAWLFELAAQQ